MYELRRRYNGFIDRHVVIWELAMAVLAVAFVVVGFMADDATGALRGQLEVADVALTAVFVLEFATRFLASFDRARYLREHWIDLVALIPVVRGVRLLRLLRLLRLVRAFAGFFRAADHMERIARHRGLLAMFVAWLAIMVLCSAFLYAAENGANEAIASPLDASGGGS